MLRILGKFKFWYGRLVRVVGCVLGLGFGRTILFLFLFAIVNINFGWLGTLERLVAVIDKSTCSGRQAETLRR